MRACVQLFLQKVIFIFMLVNHVDYTIITRYVRLVIILIGIYNGLGLSNTVVIIDFIGSKLDKYK